MKNNTVLNNSYPSIQCPGHKRHRKWLSDVLARKEMRIAKFQSRGEESSSFKADLIRQPNFFQSSRLSCSLTIIPEVLRERIMRARRILEFPNVAVGLSNSLNDSLFRRFFRTWTFVSLSFLFLSTPCHIPRHPFDPLFSPPRLASSRRRDELSKFPEFPLRGRAGFALLIPPN